jgi:hypothetical protein
VKAFVKHPLEFLPLDLREPFFAAAAGVSIPKQS